jgi:hypothetical protein
LMFPGGTINVAVQMLPVVLPVCAVAHLLPVYHCSCRR